MIVVYSILIISSVSFISSNVFAEESQETDPIIGQPAPETVEPKNEVPPETESPVPETPKEESSTVKEPSEPETPKEESSPVKEPSVPEQPVINPPKTKKTETVSPAPRTNTTQNQPSNGVNNDSPSKRITKVEENNNNTVY